MYRRPSRDAPNWFIAMLVVMMPTLCQAGQAYIRNDGDTDLYIAQAVEQSGTITRHRWVSSGWYRIEPGQTHTVVESSRGAYPAHVGFAQYDRRGKFCPVRFEQDDFNLPGSMSSSSPWTIAVRDKQWEITTRRKSDLYDIPPGWYALDCNYYLFVTDNNRLTLALHPRKDALLIPFSAKVDPVAVDRKWDQKLRPVNGSDAPSLQDSEASLRRAARSADPVAITNHAVYLAAHAESDAQKKHAMDVMFRGAALGDPVAMNNLGWALDYGWGIEQDLEDAAGWYRRAGEAGLLAGRFNHAAMLAGGRGVKADPFTAIEAFDKIANEYAHAGYIAGWMRFFGRGVEKDRNTGLNNLGAAGNAGDLSAITFLADLYREGEHGIKKNPRLGFDWGLYAAKKGHVDSMFHVARAYQLGNGTDTDQAAASEWFLKAAEAGHAEAMVYLANRLGSGKGIEKDPQAKFEWYLKAAEAGHSSAYIRVAALYEYGSGTDRDPAAAFTWYLEAAEAGSSTAMMKVATAYRDGKGVEPDPKQTFKWARQAMEQNASAAKLMVAWCYANGHGVETDHRQAAVTWQDAADQGSGEAFYHLALANEAKRGVDAGPAMTIRALHRAAQTYRPARKALAERGFDWEQPLPKDLAKYVNNKQ